MESKQTIALGMLAPLTLLSLYHSGDLATIGGVFTNPASSALQINSSGQDNLVAAFAPLARDVLGVVILVFIAGMGNAAGDIVVALAAALWILYLMNWNAGARPQLVK